jgi:hypothetical protein
MTPSFLFFLSSKLPLRVSRSFSMSVLFSSFYPWLGGVLALFLFGEALMTVLELFNPPSSFKLSLRGLFFRIGVFWFKRGSAWTAMLVVWLEEGYFLKSREVLFESFKFWFELAAICLLFSSLLCPPHVDSLFCAILLRCLLRAFIESKCGELVELKLLGLML